MNEETRLLTPLDLTDNGDYVIFDCLMLEEFFRP